MNALSYLTVLPSAKVEVEAFSNQIIEGLEAGTINPLKLKLQLKWIEKLTENLHSKLNDAALKEAEKYGKTFDMNGFKVEQVEAGIKYAYAGCGDITWEMLDAAAASAAKSKKERESFLKTVKEKMVLVNESTGECYDVHPPLKTSTTTLKFTAL